MRILSLVLALSFVACNSEAEVETVEAPVVESAPEVATPEAPAPDVPAVDLSTPAGFLEALQSAAASSDAAAFATLTEGADRSFEPAYVDSLSAGGAWHDTIMALTAADLEDADGEFWITVWDETIVEDDMEFESAILCKAASVGGAYRFAECMQAG